ncbi:hypothetical protein EDB85DRAFT_2195575 [Lactarius pseudohatsudake]|nr:hypothetical protein EDB85DRAFT_2195575 [Lactarius pseudohatsudake]
MGGHWGSGQRPAVDGHSRGGPSEVTAAASAWQWKGLSMLVQDATGTRHPSPSPFSQEYDFGHHFFVRSPAHHPQISQVPAASASPRAAPVPSKVGKSITLLVMSRKDRHDAKPPPHHANTTCKHCRHPTTPTATRKTVTTATATQDGDDGDVEDGDAEDGDAEDDGDVEDGNVEDDDDGNAEDGDAEDDDDGDTEDGDDGDAGVEAGTAAAGL